MDIVLGDRKGANIRDFMYSEFIKESADLFQWQFFCEETYLPPNRPIQEWYFDMFSVLDKYQSMDMNYRNKEIVVETEDLFLRIASYPRTLYNVNDNTQGKVGNRNQIFEQEDHIYKVIISNKLLFLQECLALESVEYQQKAQERQDQAINSREKAKAKDKDKESIFVPRCIPNLVCEKFLDSLFEDGYADFAKHLTTYSDKMAKISLRDSDAIFDPIVLEKKEELRKFCSTISNYPIAISLFPFLLTAYCVKGKKCGSIYPYFKYNKSIFPRNRNVEKYKIEIESLYSNLEQLCDTLLSKVYQSIFGPLNSKDIKELLTLPITSFESIIAKLESIEELKEFPTCSNRQNIGGKISECIKRNGPKNDPKSEDNKINIINSIFDSIAKLLNAKSYYYLQRKEIPNRNVKYAIDCLKENKLLTAPLVEKSEEEYLALYEEFCDEYDVSGRYLSRLALHTYFQIPLTPVSLSKLTYFEYLARVLDDSIQLVNRCLISNFNVKGQSRMLNTDMYRLKCSLFQQLFAEFSKDDLGDLLSQCDFSSGKFKDYLSERCDKSTKSRDLYDSIPHHWRAEIISSLFEEVLHLIGAMLVDELIVYCNRELGYSVKKKVVTTANSEETIPPGQHDNASLADG